MRLLLLLITFIRTASSLRCAVCHAIDKKTCEETQKIRPCPFPASCMSLTYNVLDEEMKLKTVFSKGCMKKKMKCEENCKLMRELHNVKNCWNSCCKSDSCNKVIHGEAGAPPKSKRSYGASNNGRGIMNGNSIVVFGTLAVCLLKMVLL